jgi:methionyl-tRNA formyltransferase
VSEGPTGGRVRTVYLGSGSFGVPALRSLAAHPRIELVGIVSAPARPVGRHAVVTPTPIGALAAALGLAPVLTPDRLRAPEAIAAVLALNPDLAVLADYGQLVPPALLDLTRGALNLHPSALPRFRGASPVPATIAAGDVDTAVSLMRMDAGLDTGPLVAQVRVALSGRETAPELEARLADLAADLLDSTLAPWLDGTVVPVPQSTEGVVLAPPLHRADGWLDPRRSAADLERLVRAYEPWPGTFALVDGGRLAVTAVRVESAAAGDVPGALVRHGPEPALSTVDGRLVLERVTPPGRRSMPGADWLRGRRGPAA